MKTIGKWIGGFVVFSIVIALFSIISPIILILGGLGIWYYTKKEPNPQKMKISAVATVIGLFGCFILLGSGGADSETSAENNSGTSTTKQTEQSESALAESAEKRAVAESIADAEIKAAEESMEAEKEAKAAAESQAEAEAKAAREAALAAEEAAKAAEEAALLDRSTYRWDISYDNLARTPDDFLGQKVGLYGRVIQVMEGNGTTQLRVAVNDDYDTVVLVEYDSSISSMRVLEDDLVDMYGTSYGLYTYTSTMGGEITIPALGINVIDIHQ